LFLFWCYWILSDVVAVAPGCNQTKDEHILLIFFVWIVIVSPNFWGLFWQIMLGIESLTLTILVNRAYMSITCHWWLPVLSSSYFVCVSHHVQPQTSATYTSMLHTRFPFNLYFNIFRSTTTTYITLHFCIACFNLKIVLSTSQIWFLVYTLQQGLTIIN
jgi:hypothetical protein